MSTRTITIPIEYSKRYAIEQYCKEYIGPRKYYIHNAVGGELWTIQHNPNIKHSEYSSSGNWVVECSEYHAIIIQLKYSS